MSGPYTNNCGCCERGMEAARVAGEAKIRCGLDGRTGGIFDGCEHWLNDERRAEDAADAADDRGAAKETE